MTFGQNYGYELRRMGERKSQCKCLCIYVDENLTFKYHIGYFTNKESLAG